MGLFDKLFSIKRKLDSEIEAFESQYRGRSCQINPEQVRLLLFKECDWRGRKLLFDSSAIQKVAAGKDGKPDVRQTENVPSIVEIADGFHYVYKGPASDASVLGEMIFGAVAMNYKSVSLKIHIMDEPKRFMCTKVFCVPTTRRVSRAERRNPEGPEGSTNNLRNGNGSKPLSVPSLREEGVSLSFSLDRGDSGYYGDLSPYSSVGSTCDYFSMFDTWDGSNSQEDFYTFHSPSGRKLSTSSNGSWQRRTFQNIATRFDLGHQSSNLLLVPTPTAGTASYDSQIYSNSSASTSDSVSSSGSLMLRKNKLGLALLITVTDSAEMDLVRRCVEHSPQLQALVCRLRLATIAAGAGGSFVSTLYKATEDAARWLTDLMYGPRLQPMWLDLVMSEPRASSRLAESLLSDLCAVLAVGDTKTTNFFISTLLTHVLTYHLGWVTTISPYDTVEYQEQPRPTERPYNALWAQLGDLCGAIGHPPRVARTVISGTANSQFLNRLLLVLTYFVRCGDVKRRDFNHDIETTVISMNEPECKKSDSEINVIVDSDSGSTVTTQVYNALVSDSVSTLASQTTLKKSSTLANLSEKLSSGSELFEARERPSSTLRRNPTLMLSLKASSDSSINSSLSDDSEVEQKVVFVLGDNDKLVGLKNKSNGGKSVKKSSKVNEPVKPESEEVCPKQGCEVKSPESPSKCCGQTLQHSKPIKHSGFKFEFDKYPQIVTNYMKSKNLEILDRHYIGKPGNLKLDNFQFDPTIVPSIQEERCETCVKCQMMESMLQTPTNASEMEYMNDMPRQLEPQYATESVVDDYKTHREMSPKTFVRRRKENTVVVNIDKTKPDGEARRGQNISREKERDRAVDVKQVLKFPVPELTRKCEAGDLRTGFDASLLGGVTDHYIPDLILQGTLARPNEWEKDLRRDLNLTSYLNKTLESPIQAVAILGDTNTWEVRVVGRDCGSGGMSSLVGAMLDALPVMWRAKVPAHHCLSFLEDKLREFCVLSKTLADMLMSTDFCDITTLTKALNIDVNDVPLLLAVATTHTPQVATRYGISYR